MRLTPPHAILSVIGTAVSLRSSRASWWATATLVVSAVGSSFVIGCLWRGRHLTGASAVLQVWPDVLLTVIPFGLAAAVLLDRRPDLPFGWLLAAGALSQALFAAICLPAGLALLDGNTSAIAGWGQAAGGLFFIPLCIQGVINIRFPSGRPSTRRGRILEVCIVAGTALVVLGSLFGATSLRFDSPDAPQRLKALQHPLTGGTQVGRIADQLAVLAPIVVILTLVAGIGVVVRFFRARGVERQQLKWRATHVLVAFALFPLALSERLGPAGRLDNTLFVLTIAIPVLRYRLWAIDTIIRRSAAYAFVTIVLVGGYVALTVLGAQFASERIASSVAAAAAALAFAPLRDRAQRLVDHLFYGQRSDPYQTLVDVGRRLEMAAPHGEMLSGVVESVASSLRLPYVALERSSDGSVVAAAGTPTTVTERWQLVYEGNDVGSLVASPRRGEDAFDERDRELLEQVAHHAGVAVHAESLTADLLESRQRLVTAREEERRRLRRDLHDGLGPVLTGIGLNLDAARSRLTSDPLSADRLVADAKEAAASAIADLRQLVYGLRPPALDDLGLEGAVRLQAERLAANGVLDVTVDVDDLPALPAAVEVAAYRTAIEAVTNAARHARASQCSIRMRALDCRELTVEVEDDGPSNGSWAPGVGLTAMRERAEELGGHFAAGPLDRGGARVVATFPLPEVVS